MRFYAKDIMSDNLITVRPEYTFEQVVEVFSANHISGAPVVSQHEELVGVVSMSDILSMTGPQTYYMPSYFDTAEIDRILADEGFHVEATTQGYVSDVMSRHVYTVTPDTPVEELAKTMFRQRVHRLIVLEPVSRKPIGIISTFDLLKLLAEGQWVKGVSDSATLSTMEAEPSCNLASAH
jgi:CBS domain-containing protein